MTDHTPTPYAWKRLATGPRGGGGGLCLFADGMPLAFLGDSQANESHLRRVVRAVNAHEKLVEALTELLCWFGPGNAAAQGAKCSTLFGAEEQARAALAAAKEAL